MKIIIIVGPTASGKTSLSIKLSKRFKGEIISADSRQVYQGMDIGTGKVTKKEMENIPHHLLDVANPKRKFTVAQYRKLALAVIDKIYKNGKIPIICGGTGFYIQAIVDELAIPDVPPDWKLRKKLERKNAGELYKILKKLDTRRAKNIDKNNPRRLVRAIEIVMKSKKPVPELKPRPQFDALIIGVKKTPQELKKLIEMRLKKRLRQGMIAEVKKLRKSGISWKRLEEFGLEYRWIARYLQNKLSYNEMVEKLQKDIEHYVKRQMTWFKKHPAPGETSRGIHWIKNYKEAERLINNFLPIQKPS